MGVPFILVCIGVGAALDHSWGIAFGCVFAGTIVALTKD